MIKKAIITTAGFGTRFLPISKTIQKEMLPILGRPFVDYVVEDLVKAGIEEIIFVINEHNFQIKHYYSENLRLYEYLKKMNKVDAYKQVAHIHAQAKFTFVVQPDEGLYGTAVPVKLCEDLLKDEEAFLVLMGDDFIYNPDGSSEIIRMIKTFNDSKARGLITCIEMADKKLEKYGVAETYSKNGFDFLKGLIEKPQPGTAPSNLVNISKYILPAEIFEIIKKQEKNPQSGEFYITDSVLSLAQQHDVVIHRPKGKYLDSGYIMGWLKANLTVAWDDPKLKKELTDFIQNSLPK